MRLPAARLSRQSKPRRRALFLERLEDRRVLASISWDGGGGDLDWNNAANWSNDALPGASDNVTIDVAGDVTIVHSAGATAIISLTSNESIDWSGGSLSVNGPSVVQGLFNNSGSVQVQSGTLALDGGGTSSGAFEPAAGAVLRFNGTHVLSGASSISGAGDVVFTGNVTVGGTYNITGSTAQYFGQLTDFTGTVVSVGQTLHMNGTGAGVVDFHGASFSVPRLELIRGTLLAGNITVGDQFVWNSGTVGGSGALTVLDNGDAAADLETLALAGQGGGAFDFEPLHSGRERWHGCCRVPDHLGQPQRARRERRFCHRRPQRQ